MNEKTFTTETLKTQRKNKERKANAKNKIFSPFSFDFLVFAFPLCLCG